MLDNLNSVRSSLIVNTFKAQLASVLTEEEFPSCASIIDKYADYLFGESESPIEELMAAAFIRSGWTFPISYEDLTGKHKKTHACFLTPQYCLGPYTIDFMLTVRPWDGIMHRPGKWPPIPEALLAVECDGFDFHDRTPEQAQHDRRRDRYCAIRGVTVLRFTGSEIHKSPMACVAEVCAHADRLTSSLKLQGRGNA